MSENITKLKLEHAAKLANLDQRIAELEVAVQEAYKKGYIDGGIAELTKGEQE